MDYAHYIKTEDSITILFHDASPITIRSDNKMYHTVIVELDNHRYSKIASIVDAATRISVNTNNDFAVVDGVVHCGEDALPESLSNMLFKIIDTEENAVALKNFWLNLKQNPSARSQKCLYDFLEANHCCVTEDGHFVGYKAVTENYLDIRTKTIDNSIGSIVEMDRSKVDDDPQHTCSFGYHVAAFDYAANSYGCKGRDRLVLVKVDPSKVVAVPYDYNNTKIRVCKYEVIGELEKYHDDDDNEPEEIKDTVYHDKTRSCENCKCILKEDEVTICYECESMCRNCGTQLNNRKDYLCCFCKGEEEDQEIYISTATADGRIEVPRQALIDAGIEAGTPVRFNSFGNITIVNDIEDATHITTINTGRLRISVSFLQELFDVDGTTFLFFPQKGMIVIETN